MLRRFLAPAALLLSAALGASALSLILLTDGQIVAASERIVLGSVTSTDTQWMDPDGDGISSIYTTVTFRVERSIKGTDVQGSDITLRTFGGTVGTTTHLAPGVPQMPVGERLLLCLLPNADSRDISPVTGILQGRWVVRTDQQGVELAKRSFRGAGTFTLNAGGGATEVTPPTDTEEPLADVIARLQAEIARQAEPVQGEERK